MRSLLLVLSLAFAGVLRAADEPVVPAGIDHGPWGVLLARYVDAEGLIDYAGWHASAEDRAALGAYLAQFGRTGGEGAQGDERIASLINAYNAFTVSLILEHFPVPSIRRIDKPFTAKRYRLGGVVVSADDIEHGLLRPAIGWKAHSVLVCAARSCPPLLAVPFAAETWEAQMEERYRTWLGRPDLHRYRPEVGRRGTVEISRIFDWYAADFRGPDDIREILARYGPAAQRPFLARRDYAIDYLDYHWGLNAQGDLGRDPEQGWLESLFD